MTGTRLDRRTASRLVRAVRRSALSVDAQRRFRHALTAAPAPRADRCEAGAHRGGWRRASRRMQGFLGFRYVDCRACGSTITTVEARLTDARRGAGEDR